MEVGASAVWLRHAKCKKKNKKKNAVALMLFAKQSLCFFMHYIPTCTSKVLHSMCWSPLSTCRWLICHGAHAAQNLRTWHQAAKWYRVQPAHGLKWKKMGKCCVKSDTSRLSLTLCTFQSSVHRKGPCLQHSALRAGHCGIRHRRRCCWRYGHCWDSVCWLHLPSFRPGVRIPAH